MKINELKPNESNPRIIKDSKFKKLVKSIKDFPEMLELRPIVIDEDKVILGGNMRYRACIQAGLKDVPVKVAKGLTEEQKQEFIVKDNVGFGEWEWDILANEWDSQELEGWGLDVWQNEDDINNDLLSKNIKAPTYKVTEKKPKITELLDTTRPDNLIEKIMHYQRENNNITEEEVNFLTNAALRHTVFNYSKIADYYAHSNKDIQNFMEESALVLIDFDKAIENGFVELTEKLKELCKNESK